MLCKYNMFCGKLQEEVELFNLKVSIGAWINDYKLSINIYPTAPRREEGSILQQSESAEYFLEG